MIEGVTSSPHGEFDLGHERDTREVLCTVHPWCVKRSGHGDLCLMFHSSARGSLEPVDFGPEASKRRRY